MTPREFKEAQSRLGLTKDTNWEEEMRTKVEYKVGREKFKVELELCNLETCRSIHIKCLEDYRKRTGKRVTMPYYDDDNDVYSDSNIDLKVKPNKEMLKLPTLGNYTLSELKEMF